MFSGDLPQVDSLRCFLAAAEHLNFRRAAAAVALTPAAFSQRIKQLEGQLGVQLFERSTHHVALTPSGQALVARAHAALEAVHACRAAAEEAPAQLTMSLGTRFELGMSWIVPAVIDLRSERPDWRIHLTFGSGTEILDRLDKGRVDAIVTSSPSVNVDWAAEVLHPETYALVGAPATLDAHPVRTPEDAGAHTLLDIDADMPLARYVVSVCPGLRFGDLWPCGTGAAVLELARRGLGIAVLPEYMIADDLREGRLIRLLPEVEPLRDSFRLMYRATSPLHESLEALAEVLRARPLT